MLNFSVSVLTNGLNRLKRTALKKGISYGDYLYIHEYDGNGLVDFSATDGEIWQTSSVPCDNSNGSGSAAFTVHARTLFDFLSSVPRASPVALSLSCRETETILTYGDGTYTFPCIPVCEYVVPEARLEDKQKLFTFNVSDFKKSVDKIDICCLPTSPETFHGGIYWDMVIDSLVPKGSKPDAVREVKTVLVATDARRIGKTSVSITVGGGDIPVKGLLIPLYAIKELTKAFDKAAGHIACYLSSDGNLLQCCDRHHQFTLSLLRPDFPKYRLLFPREGVDTRVVLPKEQLLSILKRIVKLHQNKRSFPIVLDIDIKSSSLHITGRMSPHARVKEKFRLVNFSGKSVRVKVNSKWLFDIIGRIETKSVQLHFTLSETSSLESEESIFLDAFDSQDDTAYLLCPISFNRPDG